jgi:hypothetical protein
MKIPLIVMAATALALSSATPSAAARPAQGRSGMTGTFTAPPPRRREIVEARAFRRSFFPPVIRESFEPNRPGSEPEERRRDRRQLAFWPLGGWWGPGYDESPYPSDYQPPYAQTVEPAPIVYQPPAVPICPELLTWSPKLGHATRQRLCD